jgi:hypothetical protein
MSNIENELRDAMHAAVDDARCPQDSLDLLRQHQARHKARTAVAAALAVTAVLTATAIAVALSGGGRSAKPTASAHVSRGPSTSPPPATARPTPSGSPPPSGWVRHPDRSGDYIDTPAAWHVNGGLAKQTTPVEYNWMIGTGPVPFGICSPTTFQHLPVHDAVLAVIEYAGTEQAATEPYLFPPRGKSLDLGPLGGPYECVGAKTRLVLFQDGGRFFQVQTIFGRQASVALRAQVLRSLNTLHIAPLPAADQPAALCRAGRWTYCPQAVWMYHVMNAAHVSDLGNVGTRAISSLDGNRSFGLWTTREAVRPARSQCRQIAGTTVCRIGQRLWWHVHGLVLWVAPAASPYSTPPVGPGLPARPVLARLIVASQRTPLS